MRLSPARPGFKSRRGNFFLFDGFFFSLHFHSISIPIPFHQTNKKRKKSTMRGDRTRDQSIKSRTLYQTELARPEWIDFSISLRTKCELVFRVLGKKKGGGAGYRSLCLMHAKHALYHLSYTPNCGVVVVRWELVVGACVGKCWYVLGSVVFFDLPD